MFAPIESLLGLVANPAGTIVWASGELVTLVIAAALLLSTFGLALLRERGGTAAGMATSGHKRFGRDRRLPRVA